MNDQQRKAVFKKKGPLLILAGAGSGKTTVLVNRIANMIYFGNAYNTEQTYGTPSEQDIQFLKDYIDGKTHIFHRHSDKQALPPPMPTAKPFS